MEKISIIDEGETIKVINYNPLLIKQNEIIYELNVKSEENIITFSINDKSKFSSVYYNKKMSLEEIRNINQVFNSIKSINDFYDYLKLLSDNKKLNIKKCNNKLLIIISVEVLLKQKELIIDLFPIKKDIDSSINEIYQELLHLNHQFDNIKNENNEMANKIIILDNDNKKLNGEIEELKSENKKLKEEINNLKYDFQKDIKLLKENINAIAQSTIIKEDEKNFIFTEIENKMNKKIKKVKKLYQATIDGGDSMTFHSKCDYIPNTLVLIKSEGKRRFGGFTPIPWKSQGDYINDPEMKTFIFSLDNKKIYYLKNENDAVYHDKNSGPCFGSGRDISIDGNPIKENSLFTYPGTYDYIGDHNSLSEYDGNSVLKALEYEVFQVKFF